ncbi:MAG: hypothetical protein PHY45_15735 [Rhodocyclaceae bacterium]|nr:hypothetical protein [Rhodocyclaceae bacterium]
MITDKRTFCFLVASTLLLAACDLPFLNDEEAKIEAKRQAEGMAVGSGCRYSSRALEECYGMNPKMSKAAILSGWREMDGYMRENNILVASPEAGDAAAKKDEGAEEAKPKAAEPAAAQDPAKAAEAAPAPDAAAAKESHAKQGVVIHKRPKHVA